MFSYGRGTPVPKRTILTRVPAGGCPYREIGISLPINQRQHRTLHIQKDVLPHAVGSVSAALASMPTLTPSSDPLTVPTQRGVLEQGLRERKAERNICLDNPLVRVHLIIEMGRPALRHGNLNSLFQVSLYLSS